MAELKYVGKPADNDLGLMTHGDVNQRFATQYVSQADVDAVVNPQLPPLVSLSYVQQQDALIARTTYVDQQDALYELRSDRGVANGIAYLDTNGRIPAAQMPTMSDFRPAIHRNTAPTNTNWATMSLGRTSARQLHSYTLPDPGYPYTLIVVAHVLAKSNGDWSLPACEVRAGSTSSSADIISHGFGTEQQSWQAIKVLPQAESGNPMSRTGSMNLYLYGWRESGEASVSFDDIGFSWYVWTLPAIT